MSDSKKSHVKDGFIVALKFIVPNISLIILVCLYALLGGYIFQHLEATNEKTDCTERMITYTAVENKTLHNVLTIMLNYHMPGDSNSAILAFQKQLRNFRDNVLGISYDGTNCSLLGEKDGTPYQWSLPSAILFSATIFTTVGYGNIAPKTNWGRMVCIAYAILGIPLMLLTLSNIGEILANIFRYTYLSVCCCGILKWFIKCKSQKDFQKDDQRKKIFSSNDDDDIEDDMDKISVPVIVTLLLIGSYIFIGALIFGEWINISWMDAAYFSFVTFSTVGFGDIVPGMDDLNNVNSQLKMFGTALYMIIGMAVLSMAFNLVQEEVIEKIIWLQNCLNSKKLKEK